MELTVLCKALLKRGLPHIQKTLLLMRLTAILLLATSLQLAAKGTYSQKVNIVSGDISLEKVLRLMKQQTGYSFLCNRQVLEKSGHLSLHLKNASLPEALGSCLDSRNFEYSIKEEEKVVFIGEKIPGAVLPEATNNDPPREIFGRVVNEKGDGIANASVVIAGRQKGMVTDDKGYFKIKVSDGDSLVFSFIGYAEQRLPVPRKGDVLEINLKPVQAAIAEVVVVGYGRQKKASVVGAVSTVKAEDLQVPGSQLSQGFAGQISGMLAVQSSGEPGKNAASFWIRGIATPGNTSPLVFLDGVEINIDDLNNIDPVNIENFSILKDASATALYGARGANGVILISTKRGRNLAKPNITMLAENSIVQPTRLPKFADALTFMNAYNEAEANDGQMPRYTQDQIDGTRKGLDPYVFPNVDWYKTLFRSNSLRQHANVNIRGGSKNARYYMGVSYYRDEGILKNQPNNTFHNNINDQRYNFISNLSVDVTKTTEAELSISADFNPYTGPATSAANIFLEVMNSNPVHFPALWPTPDTSDHLYFGNASGGFSAGFPNPYADMVKGYTQSFTSTALSTLKVNQKLDFFTPGLSVNLLASFKNYTFSSIVRSYVPYTYILKSYSLDPSTGKYDYNLTPHDNNGQVALSQSATNANDGNRTIYLQGLINYERNFGPHAVSGMVVYQQKEYSINQITGDITASLPHRNQGVSGRVTYAFDSRYFVEGNFGYTGSENFAAGHKYGFFPSIGVGYLISNEAYFDKWHDRITYLKVRASKGLAGNDQITNNRFPYVSIVNVSNGGTGGNGYTFGQSFNNTRSGVLITQYSNPDITWEKSDKTNIGVDLELWHKLTLNVDVFREIRSNIFQARVIPSTLGVGNVPLYANLEKVENKGIDLSLAYTYNVSKDLVLTARGTFTYAHNKVLYLDEPKYPYPYRSSIGQPLKQLRGLVADHLFADSSEITGSPGQYGALYPGNIKYKDVSAAYDKTSKIDDNDMVPMGHPTVPEITYGFGFNIVYKKWDIKTFFQGIANVSYFMNGTVGNSFTSTKSIIPFGTLQSNLLEAIANDHWSPSNRNTHAFFPRLSDAANPNDYQNSSWWLRSGAFMRLKSAELGFSPNKIVRIYANGFNLLTFSKFKLWDPELLATYPNGNGMNYPPQRIINVGVQLNLK